MLAVVGTLTRIRSAGFSLRLDGESLVVSPWSKLSGVQRSYIKANKAALVALLVAEQELKGNPVNPVPALEATAIAREVEDLKEYFEERAAIMEYDAGLPRPEAEREAAKITATYAMNKHYSWRGLRAALEGYSELLAQFPDKTGPVDALPLGVAKLAVLKGKRVVRQGIFTGHHEVTPSPALSEYPIIEEATPWRLEWLQEGAEDIHRR